MRKIEMVDLKSQYLRLKPQMDAAMQAVIDSTAFVKGPKVAEFQKNLEEYLGVDLPDDQVNKLVEAIKAKVQLDKLGSTLGGLFRK